jgi:hypothetical protein
MHGESAMFYAWFPPIGVFILRVQRYSKSMNAAYQSQAEYDGSITGQNGDDPFFLLLPDMSADGYDYAYVFKELVRLGLRPTQGVPNARDASGQNGDIRIELGSTSAYVSVLGYYDVVHMAQDGTELSIVNAQWFGTPQAETPEAISEKYFAKNSTFMKITVLNEDLRSAPERLGFLRDICQIANMCSIFFSAKGIFWSAGRIWSPANIFMQSMDEMFKNGILPVMHMIDFIITYGNQNLHNTSGPAPENASYVSRGLSLFCDQEILASVPDGMSAAGIVRRMARLAAHMMVNGPIREQQFVAGIEQGERISLLPDTHGRERLGILRMELIQNLSAT